MERERESSAEYEPNLEDERVEPLEDDDLVTPPPPTLDPDERIEEVDDGDVVPDEDRPV